jgi:hypothetical protein
VDNSILAKSFLTGLLHYWWLLAIAIIFLIIREYLRSPKFKGKFGEQATNLGLKLKLAPNIYKIVKDITINDSKGSTQIDLVVLSKYGIFVIEVKNFNGWIFGNERDKYWTQVLYSKKNKFYNPLRQNYRHIKALAELLKVDENAIHSIVFFIGDVEFKTPMPSNVIRSGLSDYIKKFRKIYFSQEEVEKMAKLLKGFSLK